MSTYVVRTNKSSEKEEVGTGTQGRHIKHLEEYSEIQFICSQNLLGNN